MPDRNRPTPAGEPGESVEERRTRLRAALDAAILGQEPSLDAQTVAERQVQHLARLVDDLLDVSRINNGKIELRKRSLDLRESAARALETARPLIGARRHEVVVTLDVPRTMSSPFPTCRSLDSDNFTGRPSSPWTKGLTETVALSWCPATYIPSWTLMPPRTENPPGVPENIRRGSTASNSADGRGLFFAVRYMVNSYPVV